jgi:hypothetical protein
MGKWVARRGQNGDGTVQHACDLQWHGNIEA